MAKVVSSNLSFQAFFCTGKVAELSDGCIVDEDLMALNEVG